MGDIVIESTVIINGHCQIEDSAYVGHYSLVGAPLLQRGFGSSEWEVTDASKHFSKSRGATIGRGVTIGSHVVIGDGTYIAERAHIDSGVKIGHDVIIEEDVEIYYQCEVSNRVAIGAGSWIGGFVCNDAKIGRRSVVFGSLVHKFKDAKVGDPESSPIVGDDAFIGMGVKVIGALRIGDGSYVGAGSVVTSDVPDGRLYLGVPARDRGTAPKAFRNKESRLSSPRR